MRKHFKVLLAIAMAAILIATGSFSAYADIAEPPMVGDVDCDLDVTVLDVTLIQRFLAKIMEPDLLELALADADADGEMTIVDATAIQRLLASMPTTYQMRLLTDYYLGDILFHSDIEITSDGYYHGDEVAYTGVPVRFTVRERRGAERHRYSLIVDGETVEEAEISDTDTHSFFYTFSQEGIYTVATRIENRYGLSAGYTREIKVIDLPDGSTPIIVGATFYDASWMRSGDGVLTVHAENGKAPYTYNYEVYFDGQDADGADTASDSRRYSTGFIPEHEIDIDALTAKLDPSLSGSLSIPNIRITVRDADDNISDPVVIKHDNYEVLF